MGDEEKEEKLLEKFDACLYITKVFRILHNGKRHFSNT